MHTENDPSRGFAGASDRRLCNVGVIGAGAWGTALALHAARIGHPTTIWAREEDVVADINNNHANSLFLPGFTFPERLTASTDLEAVVAKSTLVLSVVPTPYVGRVIGSVAHLFGDDHVLVSCSKGIENETLETVDEILERVLPRRLHGNLAYLSGPSFAKEVAENQPTVGVDPLTWTDVSARPDARAHSLFCSQGVTIASRDDAIARTVQSAISTERGKRALTRRATRAAWGR